jgi:hypothetical protein
MSEYQYYEFCSLHSPLSAAARKEMQSLSSRAKVGTHNASYVYHYGDFRGKAETLLLKHFDLFFYIANWGTIRLMFKYLIEQVNIEELRKYQIKHVISCKKQENYAVLDVHVQNEEGFGWTEGEGLLSEFLPLYEEIKSKNYQFLELVKAINDELTGKKENALSLMFANAKLSSAQTVFLDNIFVTAT